MPSTQFSPESHQSAQSARGKTRTEYGQKRKPAKEANSPACRAAIRRDFAGHAPATLLKKKFSRYTDSRRSLSTRALAATCVHVRHGFSVPLYISSKSLSPQTMHIELLTLGYLMPLVGDKEVVRRLRTITTKPRKHTCIFVISLRIA